MKLEKKIIKSKDKLSYLFIPLEIIEPRVYRRFIKKNLYDYFAEFGLTVVEETQCTYSHVLRLKKK